MKIDNAVIMAAGTSSRFAPLSYEKHKAMTVVRGEVLIERQISQLKASGISDIYIITGYKSAQFEYLPDKFGVKLIYNPDYLQRNNNGSIWAARAVLGNSYICSADNYFTVNPFEAASEYAYYAAEYADGYTQEWCMTEGADGYIDSVTIGGSNAWYMLGHAFWSREFSSIFLKILEIEYDLPGTADKLWEGIFISHLDELKMKIKRYNPGEIYEFDTLDELRRFDRSYVDDTRSELIKRAAERLNVSQKEILNVASINDNTMEASGFQFDCGKGHYEYYYDDVFWGMDKWQS